MQGIYCKYTVTKANGNSVDPKARYFVLRLDTDAHARTALRVYADIVRIDNPILALEIIEMLDEIHQINADSGQQAGE